MLEHFAYQESTYYSWKNLYAINEHGATEGNAYFNYTSSEEKHYFHLTSKHSYYCKHLGEL